MIRKAASIAKKFYDESQADTRGEDVDDGIQEQGAEDPQEQGEDDQEQGCEGDSGDDEASYTEL
jgi:hypothetical protein